MEEKIDDIQSITCGFMGTEVEANSPEEAADLAIEECPYDIENSVPANVWNEETGEIYDVE